MKLLALSGTAVILEIARAIIRDPGNQVLISKYWISDNRCAISEMAVLVGI